MASNRYLTGVIVILILFIIVSIHSAKKVNSLSDFLVSGHKMGALPMAGAITAAFIGGTSTIGTAQMAYEYGVSGIYVTLGGGIGCLVIGLFLWKVYRRYKIDTISGLLAVTYGKRSQAWVGGYTSAGIFIQVFIQIVTAIPIFKYILHVNQIQGSIMAFVLITLSVVFGGMWGSGILGLLKIVLLFATLSYAAVISVGNIGNAYNAGILPLHPWFAPFPRGIGRDLFNFLAMVVGFFSTQAFLQPLFSARDDRSARRGSLLAGVLIPVFGLMGAAIGLNMHVLNPNLNSVEALPYFLFNYLNPWLGGLAIGTILFSVITSGAALTLSMSTLITRDIIETKWPDLSPRQLMILSRTLIPAIGLLALLFALYNANTLILDWTYFSNLIRGVTVFVPFMFAALFGKTTQIKQGYYSIILVPAITIVCFLFMGYKIPPLPLGLGLSFITMLYSYRFGEKVLNEKPV